MQVGFGICLNPLALIAPWQLVCRIASAIENPEDGLLAYSSRMFILATSATYSAFPKLTATVTTAIERQRNSCQQEP